MRLQSAKCLVGNSIIDCLKSRLMQYLKHVVEDDVLFTKVISKFKPTTYSPLLTKHRPRCSKIENYTNTHTIQLYFTDNFLGSFYLFSQSQQSLTKCNLFCFLSPKLSLSFFNCSCSQMNVKWSKRVSFRSVSSTNYPTSHHPQLSIYFLHVYKFNASPNITIYKGYKSITHIYTCLSLQNSKIHQDSSTPITFCFALSCTPLKPIKSSAIDYFKSHLLAQHSMNEGESATDLE